jgi:hypothetical protein
MVVVRSVTQACGSGTCVHACELSGALGTGLNAPGGAGTEWGAHEVGTNMIVSVGHVRA